MIYSSVRGIAKTLYIVCSTSLTRFKKLFQQMRSQNQSHTMTQQGNQHYVNTISPNGYGRIVISDEQFQLMKKAFGKKK